MELKTVSIFMLKQIYLGPDIFATEYGIQQESIGCIGFKYVWELSGLFAYHMFESYDGARFLCEENGKWKKLGRIHG